MGFRSKTANKQTPMNLLVGEKSGAHWSPSSGDFWPTRGWGLQVLGSYAPKAHGAFDQLPKGGLASGHEGPWTNTWGLTPSKLPAASHLFHHVFLRRLSCSIYSMQKGALQNSLGLNLAPFLAKMQRFHTFSNVGATPLSRVNGSWNTHLIS